MVRNTLRFILLCIFSIFLLPQGYTEPNTKLKIGDLILRMGVDYDSKLIAHISKSNYSHIGMIIQVNPEIEVIHATTTDDPTRLNQVIISNLNDFVDTKRSTHYLVLRNQFWTQQDIMAIVKDLKSKEGLPFVLTADDQQPLYCTTILFDSIKKTVKNFNLSWQNIDLPVFRGKYLLPQAYIDSNQFITILDK